MSLTTKQLCERIDELDTDIRVKDDPSFEFKRVGDHQWLDYCVEVIELACMRGTITQEDYHYLSLRIWHIHEYWCMTSGELPG